MGNKITWEDILPKGTGVSPFYHLGVQDSIDALLKAEAEGKVALNPPDVEEIRSIMIMEVISTPPLTNEEMITYVANAISDRLKKGEGR